MYDHRSHAGNQGDVAKHVALVAALRHAIQETSGVFKYVDAFAGPAGSLLLPGGQWVRGVGKLDRETAARSPDVESWIKWYLARPDLVGSRYPGSALIARDLCASNRRRVKMTLWDSSAEAAEDLREVFPSRWVRHACIDPDARSVHRADFLFIDPPGVASSSESDYPQWSTLLMLMRSGRHMLAWLPVHPKVVKGRHAAVSGRAEAQLRDVLACPNTAATRVLWARGGRLMGCQLVYRTSPGAIAAIRAAVEEVVSQCWHRGRVQHYDSNDEA